MIRQFINNFFMYTVHGKILSWVILGLVFLLFIIFTILFVSKLVTRVTFFSLLNNRDLNSVYDFLEKDIFQNYNFLSLFLVYYVLICMQLKKNCKLNDVEDLVRKQNKKISSRLFYIFSLFYLMDTKSEIWKCWYIEVLSCKNILYEEVIRFDYALKLISEKNHSEALKHFIWISKRRVCPYIRFLTVYFVDTFFSQTQLQKNIHLKKYVRNSLPFLYKKFILQNHRPKIIEKSGVGIRGLLLEDVVQQALEWLRDHNSINCRKKFKQTN